MTASNSSQGKKHGRTGKENEESNCMTMLKGFFCSVVVIVLLLILQRMELIPSFDKPQSNVISLGGYMSVDKSLISIINSSVNSHLRSQAAAELLPSPQKTTTANFQEFISMAKELLTRVDNALQWIAHSHTENQEYPYLRWDLIANADVHILYKLSTALHFYLETPSRQQQFYSKLKNGFQCKALHAAQQELISKFINMDICSEIEWYKLAQLGWPEAKTIFDVGGNKGYLGSLFLTLWGGGKLGAAPIDVFNAANQLGAWKGSRNPAGYCKDGYNYGVPLYCADSRTRDTSTGHCSKVEEKIRVFSFDGSSYLTQTANTIIQNHLFPAARRQSSSSNAPPPPPPPYWSYQHYAVSNKEGKARFTKQSQGMNAGFEGGSIKPALDSSTAPSKQASKQSAYLDSTEEVNVTTIDLYLQQRGLSTLDLLKIDTEGNDNRVLLGAKQAIRSRLGMFTFEGGGGVVYSKQMNEEFYQLGYDCYSTSRAGLFQWSQGCMFDKYFGSFRRKDKGNIFCLHRQRAPLAALAFQILSFPMMIEFYFAQRSANLMETAGKTEVDLAALIPDRVTAERQSSWTEKDIKLFQALFLDGRQLNQTVGAVLNNKIDPAILLPLYVNIRGFCKPWPRCLSEMIPKQQ